MRLNPRTDKEIAEDGLMSPGIYQCQIAEAAETQSKAGNDMIKLTLTVWDQGGTERRIYDYLLDSMPKKLRNCASMCGLIDDYNQGDMPASALIGKTGQVKIVIQPDKTGNFPDRNSVQDYVTALVTGAKAGSTQKPAAQWGSDPSRKPAAPAMAGGDLDDDIPF